jgi:AP2-like factor, euAP2 lineage
LHNHGFHSKRGPEGYRWEAHIWIGKGVNKQIYLGGYEKEEHAAEAYDMAALKTKGFDTPTNFSKDRYRELEGCLDNASLEEVVTAVRRQSQGFSRGTSSFRGVSPHPSGAVPS